MANQYSGLNANPPAIGAVFGRLTVCGEIVRHPRADGYPLRYAPVRCQCGRETEVDINSLRIGRTRSCGCLRGQERKAAVGDRHGQVTVIAEAEDRIGPSGFRHRYVQARCDCGAVFEVALGNLRRGLTVTCGGPIHHPRLTHGKSRTPTYRIWVGMLGRCNGTGGRQNRRHYHERGIRVCERWQTFENFLADMGERPPGMSIERTNNDGNYEPGNCIWATPPVQTRNSRRNARITYDGERVVLQDACKATGIRSSRISDLVRILDATHQDMFDFYRTAPEAFGQYQLFLHALAWIRSRPWPVGAGLPVTAE